MFCARSEFFVLVLFPPSPSLFFWTRRSRRGDDLGSNGERRGEGTRRRGQKSAWCTAKAPESPRALRPGTAELVGEAAAAEEASEPMEVLGDDRGEVSGVASTPLGVVPGSRLPSVLSNRTV